MKFKYGDQVQVISGFFTGVTGTIIGTRVEGEKKYFYSKPDFVRVYVVRYTPIDGGYDVGYFNEPELENNT